MESSVGWSLIGAGKRKYDKQGGRMAIRLVFAILAKSAGLPSRELLGISSFCFGESAWWMAEKKTNLGASLFNPLNPPRFP
jgi:hypothetical protein